MWSFSSLGLSRLDWVSSGYSRCGPTLLTCLFSRSLLLAVVSVHVVGILKKVWELVVLRYGLPGYVVFSCSSISFRGLEGGLFRFGSLALAEDSGC